MKMNINLKQLQSFIGSNNELKPTIWADKKNYINIKHKKKLVKKYICIAPISNAPAKDWHLNKYLELLENDLFNDYQIILLGATSKKKELIGINHLVQESNKQLIIL